MASDLSDYMNATAALLGLDIQPGQRPGVLQYLGLAAAMAAVVEAAPVPEDGLELAGIFVPVTP